MAAQQILERSVLEIMNGNFQGIKPNFQGVCLALFLQGLFFVSAHAQVLTWKDTQGRELAASFRGMEAGKVILQTQDQRLHAVPVERLSEADREKVKTLPAHGPGVPTDWSMAEAAAEIDKLVLAGLKKADQKPMPMTTDAAFVRRIYLDLAGRVPTREETLAFLENQKPNKRAQLIDSLVQGPGMTARLYNYISDMLRVTDDAQKAKFFTYQEWLKQQISMNRPWNELVNELLTADGKLLNEGATGYLLRDSGMRLDNLSLTLSTFLGANVSCAQCHDHPFAEWTQMQFYQMASFFGAAETYNDKKTGIRSGGVLRKMRNSLTRLEFGQARRLLYANALRIEDGEENELRLPNDYKYKDANPNQKVKPQLIRWQESDQKLSCYQTAEAAMVKAGHEAELRKIFAEWMTSADHPRFSMTISNRLWKLLMGLGVKEPVTDLDDPSAASDPVLLAHLSREMVRLKFDLRRFISLVCQTQTYQRQAVEHEPKAGEVFHFAGPLLRRMTAEQAWDSCMTLILGTGLDAFSLKRAESYTDAVSFELTEKITPELIQSKLADMAAAQKEAGKKFDGGLFVGAGVKGNKGKLNAYLSRTQPASAKLQPASLTEPGRLYGQMLARASELRQPEREDHFLRMFGQSDRQIADSNTTEGSIPQVLMLMNGQVQKLLSHAEAHAMVHAVSAKSFQEQVEAVYLSYLSRYPTAEELEQVGRAVEKNFTPADLSWVLFNSREFIFVQ
jgi:Protein of unknown function (DUF1549)/Protein of unknown function (DUF1553)